MNPLPSQKLNVAGHPLKESPLLGHIKSPRFIVLAGPIGAGKSTAARFLCSKFRLEHASFVDTIWIPILQQRGIEPSRSALQQLGIELRESRGFKSIVDDLIDRLDPQLSYVIDDVRSPRVYQILQSREPSSILIFVQTSIESRYPRLVQRDQVASMDDQIEAEKVATETEIPLLEPLANYVVENDGDIDVFQSRLAKIAIALEVAHR